MQKNNIVDTKTFLESLAVGLGRKKEEVAEYVQK